MKLGIQGKFAAIGAFTVLTAVGLTTGVTLWLMADSLSRQAEELQNAKLNMLRELIAAKGGDVRIEDGKLMFGNYVVNGNYEIVDRLKNIAGGSATIFMGTTRVSTNVQKENGERAVGTELVGPAKEAVIDRGVPYRGQAEILGVPYFTAYDPLKDKVGRTVGVLYVGVRKSEFFGPFRSLMLISVVIAAIMAAICAFFLIEATGRIIKHIVRMTETADRLSIGEGLEDPVSSNRSDELGKLAASLERLRKSMNAAMSRIGMKAAK